MQRSWDNWNKYTDNDNKPLHGCIMFMVNLGNTVAPIYDKDGTPLNNPQLTDVYGRTQHQVFIEEDVIAYYYKYIGNGLWYTEQDIDPSDNSKWDLQYTSKSESFVGIENESKSTYAVNNIEDLRNIDAANVPSINGYKIITLMGYNEAGDKEPINYIWNSESTEPDDGGAIIATDLIKGRWIMVTPTEHLDVRHYGVFPSDSQNMLDQTLAIQYALTYANNHGLRLFFDTLVNTQYYKYYKLSNITLHPLQPIDVVDGVTFIDDDVEILSTQAKAFNGNPYFLNADTSLYSNYAKSSWNIKSLNKSKIYEDGLYIIDDHNKSTNVKNLTKFKVEVNDTISGLVCNLCNLYGIGVMTDSTFVNCEFNVRGGIGNNCNITGSRLTEYNFNGVPSLGTITSCTVDIQDFTHKLELYSRIATQLEFLNYDWQGVSLNSNYDIAGGAINGDRQVLNYKYFGSSGTSKLNESAGQHTYTFTNCTALSYMLDGNADNNVYIFNNCVGGLYFGNTNKEVTIIIQNGSNIELNTSLSKGTVVVDNSNVTFQGSKVYKKVNVINSTIIVDSLSTIEFSANDSILNGTNYISATSTIIKDTQINVEINSVSFMPDTSSPLYNNGNPVISFFMDNCILNAPHKLTGNIQGVVKVIGTWINNHSTITMPIIIDSNAYIDTDDSRHNYTYTNNSGTMRPISTISVTKNIVPNRTPTTGQSVSFTVEDYCYYNRQYDGSSFPCGGQPGVTVNGYALTTSYPEDVTAQNTTWFPDEANHYFARIKLFTIGTHNVNVKVQVYNDGSKITLDDTSMTGTQIRYNDTLTKPQILKDSYTFELSMDSTKCELLPYQIWYTGNPFEWNLLNLQITQDYGYSQSNTWESTLPSSANPDTYRIVQLDKEV